MASMLSEFGSALKAIGKMALLSRVCAVPKAGNGKPLIILANGPSLNTTIKESIGFIRSIDALTVNFAPLSEEFRRMRPAYHVLADPHFFRTDIADENLSKLRGRINGADWHITLLVPVKYRKAARRLYGGVEIATFNAVGIEGFAPLCRAAFRLGLAMPRPRNVLIPSIMLAIALGYKEIIITGADHTWMKTLSVTDENEVVSIQPHFYNDGAEEQQRIRHEYRNYRLHQIVESFAVAFKSYHDIANFAAASGVKIINATPGSFIDAFERGSLNFTT